jgi:hypothetical protein
MSKVEIIFMLFLCDFHYISAQAMHVSHKKIERFVNPEKNLYVAVQVFRRKPRIVKGLFSLHEKKPLPKQTKGVDEIYDETDDATTGTLLLHLVCDAL